ncbi:MAG TPA: LytTR family DNA-binding domain-containing protein [Candidatus Limiplasma sp.]|nr:LytTR family DNA-binding domain-containing protein [Candidatus Limiplasma sp.]HPS81037.1 LytTR family DNA-binding domain-containing protein [Candidatus Limiplasma sp.]
MMDDLRVLVADDDAGMRTVMRHIIERVNGFQLVGEAEDGEDALKKAETLKPQVVFLDVEMPKLSGVDCARTLQDMDPTTVIIFATAHDAYMSDAFEVYAFDYLVKPFKVERVMQTLERIRDRLTCKPVPQEEEMPHVVSAARKAIDGRLMLRHREGVSFIDLNDILLVQREDRATVLYTSDEGRFVTGDSLSDMEERLPANVFFRCHKSYIINLNHIKDITPYGRWTYVVRLQGTKHDALITHEKYEELEQLFR